MSAAKAPMKTFFITLSRSDYTTLRPVFMQAATNPQYDAQLLVGGSHMLSRFGRSIDNIRSDGLSVTHEIDFMTDSDSTDPDITKAFARAVQCFTELFIEDRPEMVFIVGDRWEMQAVATVANMLHIPLAHHSGGDLTQGSDDNKTRYLLSTLANLHFVSLPEHKQRLIAMGEEPWRVHLAGEPALNHLVEMSLEHSEIKKTLGLTHSEAFVLATFHPTTFDTLPLEQQLDVFIAALTEIEEDILLTAPNPDPASKDYYLRLQDFAAQNNHVHFVENLGATKYYQAMAAAKYMIGNSSSGLWEAPSFKLPVINIGHRQDDRVRVANVIDTECDLEAIRQAIQAIECPEFKRDLEACTNPYVYPQGVELMLKMMLQHLNNPRLLQKTLLDPLRLNR